MQDGLVAFIVGWRPGAVSLQRLGCTAASAVRASVIGMQYWIADFIAHGVLRTTDEGRKSMKLTFDWNCVIEVEEGRAQAGHVTDLVNHHRQGKFEVALLAASASENSRSKRFPGNADLFKNRVSALGWNDLPLVPMPSVLGLSYWDFSYIVGDGEKFKRDMDALWCVIAPKVPRSPSEHLPAGVSLTDAAIQSEELSKWRNAWCDVISAYSHIQDDRDVFVTNNIRDFQDNSEALSRLGMRQIFTPAETLAGLARLHSQGE